MFNVNHQSKYNFILNSIFVMKLSICKIIKNKTINISHLFLLENVKFKQIIE